MTTTFVGARGGAAVRRHVRSLRVGLIIVASLGLSQRAAADLASDARELALAWSRTGLHTARLPPAFLEHGRGRPVRLPGEALEGGSAACTTIGFLTGRSTDFVVKIDPLVGLKQHLSPGRAERSVAGAVLVSECGPQRPSLERLSVELRVARSALETVVAWGDRPAPAISDVLPERASGPVAALADPGPRGAIEPLATRVRYAEQRARTTGANGLRMQPLAAEPDGSGREPVRLDEGCHRIELMSDRLGSQPFDLDAEIREATTERLMGRDRSDAPDARIDVCTGSSVSGELVFAGAPGSVEVMLVDTIYALPGGIPAIWGSRARAALGAALWRRKLPPITEAPVEQRLGVAGVTSIPIPVDPGGCYVAAIGTIRGEPRSVTLTVRVDARSAFDSNAGLVDGAALAFCSAASENARIDIEVRGSAVAWVLDVWHIGSRSPDEGP